MDSRAKRRLAEVIRRRFTGHLTATGFLRTKPTFWVRPKVHRLEFVHLHLFTFGPSFRVHFGVRVLNDTFPAAALNGLSSADGFYGPRREFVFKFSEREESLEACAADLARCVTTVGLPWFARLFDTEALLSSTSPLGPDARAALRKALAGEARPEVEAASRRILGADRLVLAAGQWNCSGRAVRRR
jgi:hypothetical protein